MPDLLGTIKARAGATIQGATRDSPELARKTLDIAITLDQFVETKFREYATRVNYDPDSLELIPPYQLCTPIMQQNEGVRVFIALTSSCIKQVQDSGKIESEPDI